MIVNVECTADLAATRAALEALGTISQPTSTERLLEVAEAPGGLSGADLIDAINTVSGVCSCVDPDDAVISLDAIELVAAQATDADRWGLAHISDRLDPANYKFDANGAGVLIGNLDTPADVNLAEFGGRATKIFDPSPVPNTQTHGTWTLSLLGGVEYGIAKGATLVNLAGFAGDGSTSVSRLNAGYAAFADYVEANQFLAYGLSCSFTVTGNLFPIADPFVANIDRLVALGVEIYASAGNGDSSNVGFELGNGVFPADNVNVITVGAFGSSEAAATFSNYGGNTSIWAPGVAVGAQGPSGLLVGSGTSGSCPLAAGSGACAAQAGNADQRAWLATNAYANLISGVPIGVNSAVHKPPVILTGPVPGVEDLTGYDLVLEGGDSSTFYYVFVVDGGDALTSYSPKHILEGMPR